MTDKIDTTTEAVVELINDLEFVAGEMVSRQARARLENPHLGIADEAEKVEEAIAIIRSLAAERDALQARVTELEACAVLDIAYQEEQPMTDHITANAEHHDMSLRSMLEQTRREARNEALEEAARACEPGFVTHYGPEPYELCKLAIRALKK